MRSTRWVVWLESLALFALGFGLMTYFFHASQPRPGAELGAPGHDSFYHARMAAMLPEVGWLRRFPWLQYVYFTRDTSAFVSHHWGFHLLLAPFVRAAHVLTGDALAGARWAVSAFFGLNLVLFNLLLRAGQVPGRWVWLALFLFLPHQFYTRHAFVRAIGASLVFLQLLLLFLIRRRYVAAAVVTAAYVHLYLGAVLYTPAVVALFAVATLLGPRGERYVPWRLIAATAAGWLVGVLTYPYASGMLEFLQLQVAGSGLSPDIPVGREWKPYTDPWWFASMSATLLLVWTAALCLRLRQGPHLSATELGLLLVSLLFLTLTLKARRFIEYWPPLGLLSAAHLAAPVLRTALAWASQRLRPATGWPAARVLLAAAGSVILAGVAAYFLVRRPATAALLAEWRMWAAVLALLLLAPLSQAWVGQGAAARDDRLPLLRLAAVPASGLAVILSVALWAYACSPGRDLPAARVPVPPLVWPLLAGLYTTVPALVRARSRDPQPSVPHRAGARALGVLAAGLGLFGTTAALGAPRFAEIGQQLRCNYDLAAVRDMMRYLQTHSQPGDIVFTDDWDIFPVFFYHNTHNYYIVGLDPKFTHERRPDLWERYVKISRGQVPAEARIRRVATDGAARFEDLDVALADIRDVFGARFVITDRDHRPLAMQLARAPDFAELVYPGPDYQQCRTAPFLVFRIRSAAEQQQRRALAPPQPDGHGRLFLSQLQPAAVRQGWGQLQFDASVESRPQRLRGTAHARGLGTHAPSTLLYDIPAGYDLFEATVGIDDETGGEGSIVAAVYLDGRSVFETPPLTGHGAPALVRIPLNGARQITLRSDPTEDGQRFDHVDWASAHFARTAEVASPTRQADTLAEMIREKAQP